MGRQPLFRWFARCSYLAPLMILVCMALSGCGGGKQIDATAHVADVAQDVPAGLETSDGKCNSDDDCAPNWACVLPAGICVKKSDLDPDVVGDVSNAADLNGQPSLCGHLGLGNGNDESESCLVAEGFFPMGSPDGECELGGGLCPDEKPQHQTLVLDLFVDRFEVTNSQFKLFAIQHPEWSMEAGGPVGQGCDEYYLFDWGEDGSFSPEDANKPVTWVCWYAADAYCKWAGKSLPTEAQWEHAAKGDEHQQFPWGEKAASCSTAAFKECPELLEVGALPEGQSLYGIHDLAGNVAEWVGDWYDPSYYCDPDGIGGQCYEPEGGWIRPEGPDEGEEKVVRGGGFNSEAFWLRTSARGHKPAYYTGPDIGFRCVFQE